MPTKETERTMERDRRLTRRYTVKFNVNTDADILADLEGQPSVQGYIKNALRAYIGAQRAQSAAAEKVEGSAAK